MNNISDRPSRLLGVDYGTVRIGLAISDTDRRFAAPLATYARVSPTADAEYFQRMVREERVGTIVVGLPLHAGGEEGGKAKEAREYGKWLEQVTGLPVVFWDERWTTVEADRHLETAGLTSKQRRRRRDALAAQVMLQSFLDEGCPGLEE